jgi:zinc protease
MLDEDISAAAFKVHAYGNPIIGWKCDLRTMTRDDLYNHYKMYYAPNNATIVVAGDFDTADLVVKVGELFGGYPASPSLPEVRSIEPEQTGERRVRIEHPGSTAQIEIVYHTPSAASPDVYPLMVADALLSGAKPMGFGGGGGGRSARLYKALVTTEIAAGAGSYFGLRKDPHLFVLAASAKAGDDHEESLQKMEAGLLEEIRKLQEDEIPAEELAKAVRQSRAMFVYSSDSVSNQAYMLGYLESIYSANMYDEALDRLAAVTPQDVQRVARTYFTRNNRTVGVFVPTEEDQPSDDTATETEIQ